MSTTERLDAYHFDEQEWESYEQLVNAFEWEVPEEFNVATYACDRWAEDAKNRVAVYVKEPDGRETAYTFRQLRNYANQFANYLEAQGVDRGDRIAVNGTQRASTLISHFAAWKLGAVSVPLSSLLGTDGLKYRLKDSNTVAYVVDPLALKSLRPVRADLADLETVLTVGDVSPEGEEVSFWEVIDDQPRQFDTRTTNAEDDAQIIYTSGTTGDPKGTLHAHQMFLGLLPGVILGHRNLDIKEDDVVRMTAEWSWMGSLNDVIITNLFYGNPAVACPNAEFDVELEFDLIERFGITVFSSAPTAYRMMMQVEDPDDRWDLSSIRVLGMGGEAVGESLLEWANALFDDPAAHPAYGQTESGFCLAHCEALGIPGKPGDNYLGKPAPGYEMRIVDPETKEPIEDDEVGELAIKYTDNPSCLKEYWNKPEKTAQKIRGDWMLTEDLVEMDEDGYYVFHSRADDVILSSGYRIGPEEIEESLARHESVLDAGVIGVPHDERGEIPKAYVVLAEGYEPSEDLRQDLQEFVKGRLAKYEYPRELEFIEELPTTSTGKIRRTDLREREGVA